jgi:outer membrane protein TolC
MNPMHPACVLTLALACSSALQAAEPVPGASVESLLAYAQQHNPEVAAMGYEAQAADERIVPAGALPDPRFRATLQDITRMGTQNPTLLPARTGQTAYLWMQELPWFGKRDLKREIAQHDALGAKGRALGTWAELSSRIKSNYTQLYFVQRSEQLLQENLSLMAQLEGLSLSRYANGQALQQDVIRAQVEQGNMRSEQIALETEHHHLHARMNALLSRPADEPLAEPGALRPLPPPPDRLDWSALRERVQAKNPQLFTEDARVQSAEKGVALVRKNRYPDVTFGVSPIQQGSAFKQWELMVELNIPLQQGTRAAQEREAEAMLAAARERQQATANQVFSELTQNLSAMEAARRTELLVSTRLLPQAELTFKSAMTAYENGKVDFATLLDAQRQIRLARLNQLKAQVDAQLQLAELERILGEDL